MSNLLKLLQPPSYKSKIKLYCPFSEFKVKKYNKILAQESRNSYICILEKEVNIKK